MTVNELMSQDATFKFKTMFEFTKIDITLEMNTVI